MNKNDYLKELAKELARWLPDREREDTLRYYTEYFEEAGPEREAQVIEELGTPDVLARRLAEEGGWPERKKGVNRKALARGIAALIFVAAICLGGWLATRKPAADPPPPSGVTQSPVLSTPPQTVSPVPSQSIQPTQAPDDSLVWVVDAFTQVEANIPLGDVTLRAEGDAFRVTAKYSGTTHGEPYRIECELSGGTLKLTGSPKSVDQDGTDEDCHAEVTVTVPAGTRLDEVQIKTALGDIDLLDVHAEAVDAETALGDVYASGIEAGSIDLQTALGDVDGKDLDTDSLTMNSRLGDLSLEGGPAAKMDLHTNMGEIDVKLDCSAGECSYELSSNLGACSVDGAKQEGSAKQSVSGADYRLDAHSNMGEVKVTFKG